jgi:hypothetical protein
MSIQVIDISEKYSQYLRDEIGAIDLFIGHKINKNNDFCFAFDEHLTLYFKFEIHNYIWKRYKIIFMFNATIIASIIFDDNITAVSQMFENNFLTRFCNEKLTKFPCQFFTKYEKLLNDFCFSYTDYIKNQVLHGNILLDISKNVSIDFIAENNYTLTNGLLWFGNFDKIKSAVIYVNPSMLLIGAFINYLLQFKNNTLQYLLLDSDYNDEINLYEMLKNNFPSLLCVVLKNKCYHDICLSKKNIELAKTIHDHNGNVMQVIAELLQDKS